MRGYARSHTIPVRDADAYEVGEQVSILYDQDSTDGRVFTVDEGPSLMLEDSEGFAIFVGLLASGYLLWSLFFMILTWSKSCARVDPPRIDDEPQLVVAGFHHAERLPLVDEMARDAHQHRRQPARVPAQIDDDAVALRGNSSTAF